LTTEALRRIAELYVIEGENRGKPAHERRLVRQAKAKPLLDDLERWQRAALDKLSRKSDTSAAIMYALNLWPALVRYCDDDGVIEIDNSAAERALRGVAIGRRNYDSMSGQGGTEQTLTLKAPKSTAFCPGWRISSAIST
jgi:hypothetical protein